MRLRYEMKINTAYRGLYSGESGFCLDLQIKNIKTLVKDGNMQ
jgi:hypothetical protein